MMANIGWRNRQEQQPADIHEIAHTYFGKVIKNKDGYAVTVNNIGGFDIPFDVKINYTDGSKDSVHETPIVWKKDQKQTTVNIKTKKTIQSLILDNGLWADANEKDNVWKTGER